MNFYTLIKHDSEVRANKNRLLTLSFSDNYFKYNVYRDLKFKSKRTFKAKIKKIVKLLRHAWFKGED